MGIEQIMEGQTLSQEVKLKITEAFNAAVDAKVESLLVGKISEATEKLEEDNKLVIENKIKELETANEQYVKENIVDVVDKYLTAAANEFVKENKETIESKLQVEMAANFFAGLKSLATSFDVELPKGADNIIEQKTSELELTRVQLNQEVERRVDLESRVLQMTKESIIAKETSELTDTQREKVVERLNSVQYTDEAQFSAAVRSLAESIAPDVTPTTDKEPIVESKEPIVETKQNSYLDQMRKKING